MQTFLVLSIEPDGFSGISADFIPAKDEATARRIAEALGRDTDWILDLDTVNRLRQSMIDEENPWDHKADLRALAGFEPHRGHRIA